MTQVSPRKSVLELLQELLGLTQLQLVLLRAGRGTWFCASSSLPSGERLLASEDRPKETTTESRDGSEFSMCHLSTEAQ